MAADAFHKSVEDEMRHQKYLFSDFVKVIDAKGKAHEMRYSDFRDYTKEVSKAADTYYSKLEHVRMVRFKCGSTKLEWKYELRGEWDSVEFSKKQYWSKVLNKESFIPRKKSERGINTQKLRGIIEKIGELIPKTRMKFWHECEENDDARDLAENIH